MSNRIERNSSIELLKVVAIIMIVFSHSLPIGGNFAGPDIATYNVQYFIIALCKYGGILGNDIFIICSSWFLLENDKMDIKKVLKMMADCFVISITFLVVFLVIGYDLSIKEIIAQFMPTYMEANWYISCYIIFYLIHPYLNIIIKNISHKQLLALNIGAFIIYGLLQFLRPYTLSYSNLIGFICIYFLMALMKQSRNDKFEFSRWGGIMIIAAVCNLLLVVVTDLLGLYIEAFSTQLQRWNSLCSPFLVTTALALFMIAKANNFINKSINRISGLSMLIYIIHDNVLLGRYLKKDIFKYLRIIISEDYELVHVFIYAALMFAAGVVLSIIYQHIIQKPIHAVCDKIFDYMQNRFGFLKH